MEEARGRDSMGTSLRRLLLPAMGPCSRPETFLACRRRAEHQPSRHSMWPALFDLRFAGLSAGAERLKAKDGFDRKPSVFLGLAGPAGDGSTAKQQRSSTLLSKASLRCRWEIC